VSACWSSDHRFACNWQLAERQRCV
jgi:hypothetical protein